MAEGNVSFPIEEDASKGSSIEEDVSIEESLPLLDTATEEDTRESFPIEEDSLLLPETEQRRVYNLRPGQNYSSVFGTPPHTRRSREPLPTSSLTPSPSSEDILSSVIALMAAMLITQEQLDQTIAAAVARVLAMQPEPLQGAQGERGPAGAPGEPSASGSRWKTEEIGYFTPDSSATEHIKTIRGITYFLNVHTFLAVLRAQEPLKKQAVIRANIVGCLRDEAYGWWLGELSDDKRQDLNELPLERGWYIRLERRFKTRPAVLAGVSVVRWAQQLFRDAQAALGTHSTLAQLTAVWLRLDPNLQQDVPEPTEQTLRSTFIEDLDRRYQQWRSQEEHRSAQRQTLNRLNPWLNLNQRQGQYQNCLPYVQQRHTTQPFQGHPPFQNLSQNLPRRITARFPDTQTDMPPSRDQKQIANHPWAGSSSPAVAGPSSQSTQFQRRATAWNEDADTGTNSQQDVDS
ncbi:hypothetical protein N7495_003459 [Penicillium taxi]|uniref:uncharacterized protein n=1 Tax=Penicillium taxi TaxID=168475 RepID=UPI0025459874|nr:uncharacterized protein N7495_003459 [Penicillium taxi]KAJ5902931.1 hypothetical protein N7495_003459 [Penicillium taxi]